MIIKSNLELIIIVICLEVMFSFIRYIYSKYKKPKEPPIARRKRTPPPAPKNITIPDIIIRCDICKCVNTFTSHEEYFYRCIACDEIII